MAGKALSQAEELRMRQSRLWAVAVTVAATTTLVVSGVVLATSAAADNQPSKAALAIARQTLAPNDGWASSGTGTTGGLAAALGGNNATNASNATPKIIFVSGGIQGNVDDADTPLTCANYADPAYSF